MTTHDIFVSYARDDHQEAVRQIVQSLLEEDFLAPSSVRRAAHQLIQALLGEAFIESRADAVEAAEDQAILARAFKEVISAWRERKSIFPNNCDRVVDPRQVVRALFSTGWQDLHGLDLDDAELNTLFNDLERELIALQFVCDPDEDHPPVDH